MKRFLVLVALVPALASANELSVGTVQVSGGSTLGFGSSTNKTEGDAELKTSQLGLNTSTLYYVTPMVGVGGTLEYTSMTQKQSGTSFEVTELFIGPKVGLDLPVAPQLAVFVDGELGYVRGTTKVTGAPEAKGTGWGLGLGGGLKYFLVPAVSADVGLLFRHGVVKEEGVKTTTNNVVVSVGLSAYFGGASHGAH